MTRRHSWALVLGAALAALAWPLTAQDPQALLRSADPPANGLWLDSLNLARAPIRRPRAQRGQPPPPPLKLTLGGLDYPHGLPLQVNADLIVDLKGGATRFLAMAGIDDERKAGQGSVTFDVWVDGKQAYDSGVVRSGDQPRLVSVNLTGAKQLILSLGDAGDTTRDDSAIWGGALLQLAADGQKPELAVLAPEPAPAIAPSRTAAPRINSPRITGGTPGRWFQFRIPASGEAPLTFSAKNLPAGVTLDPKTGVVTGALKAEGKTVVDVTVKGPKGQATGQITVVGGRDALALTPPLGWNSWNVWGGIVDDAKVRAAADALVSSGLAAQGYTTSTSTTPGRGTRDAARASIMTNEKFPDMKALVDYIHSKGLKIGIYSSPGQHHVPGCAASYEHEEQDARTWASGASTTSSTTGARTATSPRTDSPRRSPAEAVRADARHPRQARPRHRLQPLPVRLGERLGMGRRGRRQLWRMTGDITDSWSSMSGIGFAPDGTREVRRARATGTTPTCWSSARSAGAEHCARHRLTPNEQITHITLWSLQAAPLLIGADMSQLDQFTIDLLGQRRSARGQPGCARACRRRALRGDGRTDIWARPLSDGTMAVGLFNRRPVAAKVSVTLKELGLGGAQPLRDLWRHQDLGRVADVIALDVPRHGAAFLKVGTPRK